MDNLTEIHTQHVHNQQIDRMLFGDPEDRAERIQKMATFECGMFGTINIDDLLVMSDLMKKSVQNKVANILDVVFDARENLKDSEYKNLT